MCKPWVHKCQLGDITVVCVHESCPRCSHVRTEATVAKYESLVALGDITPDEDAQYQFQARQVHDRKRQITEQYYNDLSSLSSPDRDEKPDKSKQG